MLSRLFMIPTLLLVWITTVAIGAPVAETIEVIKAVKIPQIGSGNLTLNRRFLTGIPGLPQCSNEDFPAPVSSYCLNERVIRTFCTTLADPDNGIECETPCLPDTTCMDFETDPGDEQMDFAVCIDDEFIKEFENDRRDGIFCKSYNIKFTNGVATVSFNIYDAFSNPAKANSLKISMGDQTFTKQNTNNYSRVLSSKNDQKIEVCIDAASSVELFAKFSYLDGSYS